ncbi:NAD-dependent epimerase/dehydratase family protein [Paenibacillus sp. P96]|uniref:NAD-dependent epimerase/dehydratase family protein n=1 Tax=Paenibacillus zeirhizosphaerae TaxID=2987519 RepID=A0ABT9FU50_9BACL|nr:NAD-dependent epimerase/dehydratase family protein [Paenibacillus sp. P96]MDP4097992.1 NAD-dependent epimerase/dehydratase family protein [Paenibacillus sp. P96]
MKIFITGVTGYIGGSVAKVLLEAGHSVYGLTRNAEQNDALIAMGIEPVIGSLEDEQILTKFAQMSDGVIHTADTGHQLAIDTFINAMEGTGKPFIHTSGSGIAGDDARGDYEGQQIYEEESPIVRELVHIRINEQVRKAGVDQGIRSIVIVPTMVYGTALGLSRESVQLPPLIRKSKELGAGVYIGKGANRWSNVHIKDLAQLYLLALEKAPSASYFYAENGEESFKDLAKYISEALGYGGQTVSWSFDDAVKELGPFAQYTLATNSRVRAVHARNLLGWKPAGETIQSWISQNVK